MRFEIRFLHRLPVTSGAPCKPGKPLVSYVPDIAMTLHNQITRDLGRAANVVSKHAVVLFRLPFAGDVVANQRKGNIVLRQGCENIRRMRPSENDSAWPMRFSDYIR